MKTVLIYDQCGESPISFLIVDGDRSHLNGFYLNGDDDDMKDAELNGLLFDYETNAAVPRLNEFPTQAVKDGALVVVVGFIP